MVTHSTPVGSKGWNEIVRRKIMDGRVTRRDFVVHGTSALLATGVLAPNSLAKILPAQERPVLHIIGHSHIDAAWLWPWTDSADVVMTTFRSALDRMNETPGFCYSHSSTAHYKWVQQSDAGMFDEIRARIREGRWEVVGGWPVEPDCNIPSTESFARHCLYGKRFCEEQLGVDVKIGFNPDSFGHAAGLPTILKHAGYKYYVFMRPQEHEAALPRLFWWEGPDGSRVLTYHIYGSYDWYADRLQDSAAHAMPEGSRHGAFFLGVGDHGGAVTKVQLQKVSEAMQRSSEVELRWSTVRQFFEALEASLPGKEIPVIRGDLQHHARGCYSACAEEKYQNRRAEHELFRTESVAVMAGIGRKPVSAPASRRGEPLAAAWERVLFNQFHDVLAGTSLYSDYENARDGIGSACQQALETRTADLLRLAKQVNLHDVSEGAVFAYNPLPWARPCLLEFHYGTNSTTEHFTNLKAPDGARTALQTRPSDSMTDFYKRLSSWVDLPACGYKVFTIEPDNAPLAEADSYGRHVTVARDGFGLKSFKAKDGSELLASAMGLVVIEDKSDTWAHDVAAFRDQLGRPTFISSEVVEDGPVTRVTRQKLRWRSSDIVVDVAEYAAMDAVEFRFVMNWREHEQMLKLEIPVGLNAPRVFAKVPGAALERATNGNEEPYQDWVALQGEINGADYTLALANDATYSYDCKDNLLRTVLIRSAPYARHNPNKVETDGTNAWQDQGRQERKFWLMGGGGSFSELALDRRAYALQTPAEYVLDSRHGGEQPKEQSFFAVTPDTVEVLAIKQAEDGKGVVLRMQERCGRQTRVRLRSSLISLDEEVTLRAWELQTLRIVPGPGKKAEVQLSDVMEGGPGGRPVVMPLGRAEAI